MISVRGALAHAVTLALVSYLYSPVRSDPYEACVVNTCTLEEALDQDPTNTVLLEKLHRAHLKYPGRGTVDFTIEPLSPTESSFTIAVGDHKLTIESANVSFSNQEFEKMSFLSRRTSPVPSLTHFKAPRMRIWVSLSARRPAFIKVGYGYLMQDNVLVNFESKHIDPNDPEMEVYLRDVHIIELDPKVTLHNHIQPFITDELVILDPSPFLILATNRERHHDLLDGLYYLPTSRLPPGAAGLLEQVTNWHLTPQEISAIQYSVDTPGCFLYKVVEEKRATGHLASYLRAQLQEPRRTAPGQEMVLEVWLKNQTSPIHDHGDASAVIKVLHGSINTYWYNPIMNGSDEEPQLIKSDTLRVGNYTWMTDSIYQTHRLENNNTETVAISIQAYSYEEDTRERREFFTWMNDSSHEINEFFPHFDFEFSDIAGNITKEYLNRTSSAVWQQKPLGAVTFLTISLGEMLSRQMRK